MYFSRSIVAVLAAGLSFAAALPQPEPVANVMDDLATPVDIEARDPIASGNPSPNCGYQGSSCAANQYGVHKCACNNNNIVSFLVSYSQIPCFSADVYESG